MPYSISQNFLTSTRMIERLLDLTDISGADSVWEIGAGKGHITQKLLQRSGHVTAVEIDPKLSAGLSAKLAECSNLRLVQADFLKMKLPYRQPYKVFANIPFSRTTAIMNKLTTAENPPQDCWLIMEKGAAKRFLGMPRETRRSLCIKPFFEGRIAFYIDPAAFHPKPSVACVLVHFHRKERPDMQPGALQGFVQFVRQMERCMVGHGKGPLTRREAATVLRRHGLEDIPQSATMSYVQWLCLFRWWKGIR